MPQPGAYFPAEELILALRAVGLQHGQFGIFHSMAEGDEERIRYSVASLVEPGSFDLSNLKDSRYQGISIFMVLPAPEDGVELFDEMLGTARDLTKRIEGNLVDEQGSAMSMQRERYMREEVIEFQRRRSQSAIRQNLSADS
jgi:cell division protein ZipA